MAEQGILAGRRGLVMGVANNRSIAWGIARACAAAGARLAFTYQGEALRRRVQPLAEELGVELLMECDVSDEESLAAVFETLRREWGGLDFVVHAIAFSDKDELKGRYVQTSRANFTRTMDISVYSFTAVARLAEPLMKEGGALLTLSYYGAEKWVPHYNVMGVAKAALEASVRYLAADMGPAGVRVNAISAGPIRTLAAAGISGFRMMLDWNEANAPLRRNVSIDEVGAAALFLLSDMSSGITGEVMHVDAGYNIIGMRALDE